MLLHGWAAAVLAALLPWQALAASWTAAPAPAPAATPHRATPERPRSMGLQPRQRPVYTAAKVTTASEPQRMGWRITELEGEVAALQQLATQQRLELERIAAQTAGPARPLPFGPMPMGVALLAVTGFALSALVTVLRGQLVRALQALSVRVAGRAVGPLLPAASPRVPASSRLFARCRYRGVRVRNCTAVRRRLPLSPG
jgi:hypothetical protein